MFTDKDINSLKSDCKNCFGYCCTALYFSKTDGFPVDKPPGTPCPNLDTNFLCKVHKNLKANGFKGCLSYECYGAGQKVAMVTYKGMDWRLSPNDSKEMFQAFVVIHQLHQMALHLISGLNINIDNVDEYTIALLNETIDLTYLDAASILKLDLLLHGKKVYEHLIKTSEVFRKKHRGEKPPLKYKKTLGGSLDLIGKDLRKVDLSYENLRYSYLIAANLSNCNLKGTDFTFADLRDTNIRGADLSESLFLTQMQINSAIGDSKTKLPKFIERPDW